MRYKILTPRIRPLTSIVAEAEVAEPYMDVGEYDIEASNFDAAKKKAIEADRLFMGAGDKPHQARSIMSAADLFGFAAGLRYLISRNN